MAPDPKRLVKAGYDACADRYTFLRENGETPDLIQLLEHLPTGDVLDIGCGGGRPVTHALARRSRVTGVDVSLAQLRLAQLRVPSARFIAGDIMEQSFPVHSFDGIVAIYALFHIPRDEHSLLFERMAAWLRPGGFLLVTLGSGSDPGHVENDFFGVPMYWSSLEPDWYAATLERLGLHVAFRRNIGHGYDPAASSPPEQHPVILAQRIPNPSSEFADEAARRVAGPARA